MKNKKEKTQRQRRKSNSPGWKAGAYLKLKVSTKGAQAKALLLKKALTYELYRQLNH